MTRPTTTTATPLIKTDAQTIDRMTSNEEILDGGGSPDVRRQTSGGRVAVCLRAVKADLLIVVTLVAVLLGVGLGFALREAGPSEDALTWIGLPGEVFLRCLNATIVPLVICMVITSTATLDPRKNGKIAVIGMLTIVLSHLFATIIAICMFFIFKPDKVPVPDDTSSDFSTDLRTQDVFADLVRNIFPDNIVSATFTQATTQYVTDTISTRIRNDSDPMNYTTVTSQTTRKRLGNGGGTNIMGLIAVCSAIGMASNKVLSPGCEFLKFFEQAQKVTFTVIRWIFWMTPVGVASLIGVSLARVDDISAVFHRLGLLIGAVSSGLVIHLFLLWALIIFLVTRRNPFVMITRCTRPFVVAFSATATSVALPDMMTSCDLCGVSGPVSSFLLPMTVNLQADGSSIYIASSALFLAQSTGGGATVGDIVVTGAMTTVLSCAIPPVPSSSIVTLVIILTSLNLPLHDVALLFAAEWLLDRMRSGINGVTHVLTCLVTDKLVTPKGHTHSEENIEKNNVTEDSTSRL